MPLLPKRKPYDAPAKSKIDTRGMKHPKPHFVRDAGHRAYVRRHRCALYDEGYGDCPTRQVECAHVETGGMGIKCDDTNTAPLCSAPGVPKCHHALYDQHKLPQAARAIVKKRARELREEWETQQAAKREKKR